MGSFSWTRADKCTERSNFTCWDRYKILVPMEFGGGYIEDIYYDYGYIFKGGMVDDECGYVDGNGVTHSNTEFKECDLYGVLAYWNKCNGMEFIGSEYPKTMVDILKNGNTCDNTNRDAGIDIGCLDEQIDKLKYPLKLVSYSCNDTYESCKGKSYSDPNQGFDDGYWGYTLYNKYYNKF